MCFSCVFFFFFFFFFLLVCIVFLFLFVSGIGCDVLLWHSLDFSYYLFASSNICETVWTKLRDMQDCWLSQRAEEIQSFADRKDMKSLFDALKRVYGPQNLGTTPLLSADGTSLLTDKEAILKIWVDHFVGASSINDQATKDYRVECK